MTNEMIVFIYRIRLTLESRNGEKRQIRHLHVPRPKPTGELFCAIPRLRPKTVKIVTAFGTTCIYPTLRTPTLDPVLVWT